MSSRSFLATLAAALFTLLTSAAGAQGITPGPVRWLPGDAAEAPAVHTQEQAALAAGSNGFLAVWQDQRTILAGAPNTPGDPLLGNSQDVYGARLDAAGNVIDRRPLVIGNGGHVQGTPKAAWNGASWLVVFTTHRPGDYYNTDLVGVRISAAGALLDATPIVINRQLDNNTPGNPVVASDGNGWAVAWEEFSPAGVRGVQGTRVDPDGTVVNPNGKDLWYDSWNSYAHHIAIGGAPGAYLVAWVKDVAGSRTDGLVGLRLTADLAKLDAAPIDIDSTGGARRPGVASDGNDFLVAWQGGQAFTARVPAAGPALPPGGFALGTGGGEVAPAAAWNGFEYVVAFGQAGSDGNGHDVFFKRVGRDGRPLDAALLPLATSDRYEYSPGVASLGDGTAQAVYVKSTSISSTYRDDVAARRIQPDGGVSGETVVTIDRPRQTGVRIKSHAAGKLAVFVSDVSGETRILAQRLDTAGNVLDADPVVVASGPEGLLLRPDAAWNGSFWQVVWQGPEGILGRRLSAAGTPLEAPRVLFPGTAWTHPAVGALGGDFLVVGTEFHKFSTVWQNWLKGSRVRDGVAIDTPFLLRGGYEQAPRVAALGGRWLVVWESQVNHSSSYSGILGAFVDPAGVPTSPFALHTSGSACGGEGCGDDPDVAVQGDTAMVVWFDNLSTPGLAKIDGRLLKADGTFPGAEIEIVQASGDQLAPAVTGDGQGGWVAAWADYRGTSSVTQLRADIYAARLDAAGTVLDPGGVQITAGPLSEVQPELAAVSGAAALLAYSAIDSSNYRIALRTLGATGTGGGDPEPPASAIASLALTPASVVGGKGASGTVTLANAAPAGGAKVMLQSANPSAASVPVSVTVPAGVLSAKFAIRTVATATPVTVGITATYSGAAKTAALTVTPPALSGFTLTPATFVGGCQGSTGKVTLNGPAPAGGMAVALSDANPAASVPASVTVPAGATSVTFPITAPAVTSVQSGAVTATLNGLTRSVTLKVTPVGVLSLALSPNPVTGPAAVTGTVTLSCPAPAGGTVVTLGTSTTAVARPATASLTIPAGSTAGTFTVTTADVSVVSYATIRAVAGGVTRSVRLTVNP